MAQVGLHGLTGLLVGEHLLNRYVASPVGRRALLYGFVVGNLLPDLDYLAVVGMYPVNHTVAMHLHRGFSHSLLAATALMVGLFIAALLMADPQIQYLGFGLGLGVMAHFTLDIFIWFSPVDVFWPASVFGIIPPINLWAWLENPPLVGRLLGAAEFAAFALYYEHLAKLAVQFDTNREMIKPAQRMATVCWLIWGGLTALAFDIPEPTFTLYLYVPMGIVFMPAVFYITARMESTIEMLADYGQSLEP